MEKAADALQHLKERIRQAVGPAVTEFVDATGLAVNHVEVDFMDITTYCRHGRGGARAMGQVSISIGEFK